MASEDESCVAGLLFYGRKVVEKILNTMKGFFEQVKSMFKLLKDIDRLLNS